MYINWNNIRENIKYFFFDNFISLTMKVKSLPKFIMEEIDILYHSNTSHSFFNAYYPLDRYFHVSYYAKTQLKIQF